MGRMQCLARSVMRKRILSVVPAPMVVAPPTVALRRAGAVGEARTSSRSMSDFISPAASGRSLRLDFAAACLPHPDKVKRGGEDGYFACPSSSSFGIADGVGGWACTGVDPGAFARHLLRFAYEGIIRTPRGTEADLQQALWTSSARLTETQTQGGSTALLGQLNKDTISILNLGDSGVILLRPALRTPPGSDQPLLFPRVVFRSSDQTHYFNCPYQLGSSSAPAEVPDLIHVRVRIGDLVIAATDGVFDNLFDHQVQAIVARHLGNAWRRGDKVQPHLQGLAASIAKQAQRIGQQEDVKDIITPFALSAHSEGLTFRGGKLDDTTIVIGLVCNGDEFEDDSRDENAQPSIHNW
mmetsp:Transcript_56736/g.99207  ORF Transcript_56736/g.99207 Transcript_56736/m.99207 type:complete len:354 (+) Transcript_56736:50-1111(+)